MTKAAAKNKAPDAPSEEEVKDALKAQETYYNSATSAGFAISQQFILGSQVGRWSGSPHYRAVAGFSMIDIALTEMGEADADQARATFDELVEGIVSIGKRLGIEGSDGSKKKG